MCPEFRHGNAMAAEHYEPRGPLPSPEPHPALLDLHCCRLQAAGWPCRPAVCTQADSPMCIRTSGRDAEYIYSGRVCNCLQHRPDCCTRRASPPGDAPAAPGLHYTDPGLQCSPCYPTAIPLNGASPAPHTDPVTGSSPILSLPPCCPPAAPYHSPLNPPLLPAHPPPAPPPPPPPPPAAPAAAPASAAGSSGPPCSPPAQPSPSACS